jgi:hypothetical protein
MMIAPSTIVDESLLLLQPNDEVERVIRPQKFVVLHHIRTVKLNLMKLCIGGVDHVPFAVEYEEDDHIIYKLKDLDDPALKRQLSLSGYPVACLDPPSIALPPAIDVYVTLRNYSGIAVPINVALIVQEDPS